MNKAQRRIVGVTILVIGIAIMIKTMDWMIASPMSPLEEAAEFGRTWIVWVIGAAVIGTIEYYLFAD